MCFGAWPCVWCHNTLTLTLVWTDRYLPRVFGIVDPQETLTLILVFSVWDLTRVCGVVGLQNTLTITLAPNVPLLPCVNRTELSVVYEQAWYASAFSQHAHSRLVPGLSFGP